MEHSTKRNHPLQELITQFETMCENGNVGFLEEKTFFELINYYEDEFLLDEALEVVNYALKQYAFNADFLLTKAKLLLLKDKPYRALKCLDQAELLAPSDFDVALMRARVFSELGDNDQSLTILAELESGSANDDRVELFIAQSLVYENMKDFDGMFNTLSLALELDPKNTEALERVWMSVEISKMYEESILLHKRLLDRDAYSFMAWFNLGNAYACLGEYDDAIEALEFSFLINPEFEMGYLECAEICCQKQKFAQALNIYQELVERFGADSEILVKSGECLIQLDRFVEAKEVLIEALKLDPYDDEVYYFLGQCFFREGRYENSVSALLKALRIEDRREEYYALLAKVYVKLNKPVKADYYFRKSTEIGPEQDVYWAQHVRFLMESGKFEKAMDILDEADYHTVGADLMYFRAICLMKIQERKKALKVLDEALSEDFKRYPVMFEFCPELEFDRDFISMLRYYQGEKVNFLH